MKEELENLKAQIHFKENGIPSIHAGYLTDETITSIINLVDKEIIGEDELHSNGKKLVNPWSCDDCGQDEPGYVRNELRAKMREKLHAKTL